MNPLPVPDLGGYLREQRQAARLSLRQLADVAGVSNPYLSQIERGLKRPSAEILQQLAKGLRISAESLYVRAGILEERAEHGAGQQPDVAAAILADPRLTDRQRRVLLDVYASLIGEDEEPAGPSSERANTAAVPGKSASHTGRGSTRGRSTRTRKTPAKTSEPAKATTTKATPATTTTAKAAKAGTGSTETSQTSKTQTRATRSTGRTSTNTPEGA